MPPKTTAAPLPATIVEQRTQISSITTRIYNPELGATYALSFVGLSVTDVDKVIGELIEEGYSPCLSPDAPKPVTEPRAAQNGSNKPKNPGLTRLPFAIKGQWQGATLTEIETKQPRLIDWLAKNSSMEDIRAAALWVQSHRPDDEPPF